MIAPAHCSQWATLFNRDITLAAWLLVVGALLFWNAFRGRADVQGALRGVNDVVASAGCVWLLMFWKLRPWLVVLTGGDALL